MTKLTAAIIALFAWLAPLSAAFADEPRLVTLTAADAARTNQRRPADWLPHVKAGDRFEVDASGLMHIPTVAPALPGPSWMFIDDIEEMTR